MEDGRFFLTRNLVGRKMATTREHVSDVCALPGWFDGLTTEIEAEAQPSNLLRREGGRPLRFFLGKDQMVTYSIALRLRHNTSDISISIFKSTAQDSGTKLPMKLS